MRRRCVHVLAALVAGVTITGAVVSPKADEVLIGTGSKAGIYYHVGRAICHLVDRHVADVTCKPLETAGSVFNLSNVRGGALEMGLAQSDLQY